MEMGDCDSTHRLCLWSPQLDVLQRKKEIEGRKEEIEETNVKFKGHILECIDFYPYLELVIGLQMHSFLTIFKINFMSGTKIFIYNKAQTFEQCKATGFDW